MPRCVRNFWLEGNIDGYKSKIVGGAKRSDGGFRLDIYQRSDNTVTCPLEIRGRALSGGELELIITMIDDKGNKFSVVNKTKR